MLASAILFTLVRGQYREGVSRELVIDHQYYDDKELCEGLPADFQQELYTCLGLGDMPKQGASKDEMKAWTFKLAALTRQFNDEAKVGAVLCGNDGDKIVDCYTTFVKERTSFFLKYPQCEKFGEKAEFEEHIVSLSRSECIKDGGYEFCYAKEEYESLKGKDICDVFFGPESSCCVGSAYAYKKWCGIDISEDEDGCPKHDLTANKCRGFSVEDMTCFAPSAIPPREHDKDVVVDDFCAGALFNKDKKKCEMWSCCKWAGGKCSSVLLAGEEELDEDCFCKGDSDEECNASVAATFYEGSHPANDPSWGVRVGSDSMTFAMVAVMALVVALM